VADLASIFVVGDLLFRYYLRPGEWLQVLC